MSDQSYLPSPSVLSPTVFDSTMTPKTLAVSPCGELHKVLNRTEADTLAAHMKLHRRNFRQLMELDVFIPGDHRVVQGWRRFDQIQFLVHKETSEVVPIINDLDKFYEGFLPRFKSPTKTTRSKVNQLIKGT